MYLGFGHFDKKTYGMSDNPPTAEARWSHRICLDLDVVRAMPQLKAVSKSLIRHKSDNISSGYRLVIRPGLVDARPQEGSLKLEAHLF